MSGGAAVVATRLVLYAGPADACAQLMRLPGRRLPLCRVIPAVQLDLRGFNGVATKQ